MSILDFILGFSSEFSTGRAEYITGCTQFCLTPSVDERGAVRPGEWFDVQRLEVVDAGIVTQSTKTGGPQRDMPR